METKQKTPVEKLKDWAELNGYTNGNLKIIIGELEAAELYAGQTKQQIDALQKFKDYVHKRLDDAGIEKEPNGEHSKAGCRIGDRLDIVLKQSSPVSLESVQTAWENFVPKGQVLKEDFITAFELGYAAQQPASIAWLSEEEIQTISLEYGEDSIAKHAMDRLQTELRKRVIDPVEFAEWLSKNRWEYLNGYWYCSHPANVDPHETTEKMLQIYINNKTKKHE